MSEFSKNPNRVQHQSNQEWLDEYERSSTRKLETPKPTTSENFCPSVNAPVDDELEVPALIPEGEYTAKIIANETQSNMFGGGKLKLRYEIWDKNNNQRIRLDGWFNVTLLDEPRVNGRFKVRPGSKYRKEFAKIVKDGARRRLDRLFPSLLEGVDLIVEVITVRHDSDGEAHAAGLEYSKVKRIIKKK